MVEDAFLTIEAVPKESVVVVDSTSKSTNNGNNNNSDSASSSSNNKSQSKTTKEPKTVGEKVMAENDIARALAAIPHLFLRDIRIRFIIRDQRPDASRATPATSDENVDTYDLDEHDIALEFGVDFLSVASGEDVLGQFRTDDDLVLNVNPDKTAASLATNDDSTTGMHSSFSSLSELQNLADQHEYLSKRIRTGKGPEGGIWLMMM